MDRNKHFPTILEIRCKDLRLMRLRFKDANTSFTVCQWVRNRCAERSKFFAFDNKEEFPGTPNGWEIFDWEKEFRRQGLDEQEWQLFPNYNYALCDTYPKKVIVPASITPATLQAASRFRSHERFPVLCWQHPRYKSTLSRCSQPMVGLMQQRSIDDEKMVQAIASLNPNSQVMFIVDCRPWVSAYANTARGAGTEKMTYYTNCQQLFMNIDNIHTMRESFKQMLDLCEGRKDRWFEGARWRERSDGDEGERPDYPAESRSWLGHTSLVLCSADKIAQLIDSQKASVLVHCSDGWDRTTQLVALAQLILDPYYRTIEGFEVLIEKEWLAFGHRFNERSGHTHQRFFENKTCSPIFMQFMDCVYQLLVQFNEEFEFNEQFLITTMDHVYSCKYGTFLCDSEKQRVHQNIKNRTKSLWTYLNHNKKYFVNEYYRSSKEILNGLRTTPLTFWQGYYLRYKEKNWLSTEFKKMRLCSKQKQQKKHEEACSRLEEAGLLNCERQEVVQCTVYRSEESEAPYLVAKIASPNKQLVEDFCDNLRSLTIIDDYSNHSKCIAKASDDRPRIKRRSASLLRLKTKRVAQSRKKKDKEHRCRKSIDAEEDWTFCDLPTESEKSHPTDGPCDQCLDTSSDEEQPQSRLKSPAEAAWELRNEVITLQLEHSSGSWTLPSIRFSDYLQILRRYSSLALSFQWPYSLAQQ